MTKSPNFTIEIHLHGVTASNLPGEIFSSVAEAKGAAFIESFDQKIQRGRDAFGIPMRGTFAQVLPRTPVLPWCPLPYRTEHHSPVIVR